MTVKDWERSGACLDCPHSGGDCGCACHVRDENRRLLRLLMTARRIMVCATPYPDEEAWWAEVDEVMS